jgi:hypothetical protein
MADEELWPGADVSDAEAFQEFVAEKYLPASVRGARKAAVARPVEDDPSFAATSSFYIVPAGDGARDEFLSESELLRQSRLRRTIRRTLGGRPFRGAVAAALLLGLLAVRGTEDSPAAPPAAILARASDSPGATSGSDRGPAPVDIAFGQPPDRDEGAVAIRPEDGFSEGAAPVGARAEALSLQTRLSARPAIHSTEESAAQTALPPGSPQLERRPAGTIEDGRQAETARDQGIRELETAGRLVDDRAAAIAASPPVLTARRPAVAVLLAPADSPAAIRDPTPPDAGDAASASAGGAVPWRDLLAGYRTAYERRDARLAKQVWPAVDEGALARAFDALESQAVTFDTCSVSPGSDHVVASCRGTATYVTRMGHRTSHTERRQWTFQLEKSGPGWVIESVEVR